MADRSTVETALDFAIAAYQEDGRWVVAPLPPHVADDLDQLVAAMRQLPADAGSVGMLSVADDFFVVARLVGGQERWLLSDVTAAQDWPLARAVLARLELPVPQEDELEHVTPGGDLDVLADLGVSAIDVVAVCEDLDLFPDEALTALADRAGFGSQLETVLDQVLD